MSSSKLRKAFCWLLAQTLIVSAPLSAMASQPLSTNGVAESTPFELPINEQIPVNKLSGVETTALNQTSLPETSATVNASASTDKKVEVPTPSVTAGETLIKEQPSEAAAVLQVEDVLGSEATKNLKGEVKESEIVLEQIEGQQGNALVVREDGVLVVDNDYDVLQGEEKPRWEEIKDEPGKTVIKSGARFAVGVVSQLSSKTCKIGDPVEARLKTRIMIGGRLIAEAGDKVVGHVSSCMRARRILHAELSKNRWMRANGCVGLTFDYIITKKGEHLPLVAAPARSARIVKNVYEGRVLGINHKGEVASPLSTQLKHQAAHLAIRGAASAGGVFSFGIVPVAYGVIGAMNPNFAFLQPVGKNVPHRRLKGFAMGVVSGLPGGFLVADYIIRGKEAEIKPGDEFLVEFHQDFTGEASTDASLIPGANQNVHGEVVKEKEKK